MSEKNGFHYVLCLSNEGHEFSLEPRKLYQLLPDPEGSEHGMLRVVDETGEDYLFPASLFVEIGLPEAVVRRLAGDLLLSEGTLFSERMSLPRVRVSGLKGGNPDESTDYSFP